MLSIEAIYQSKLESFYSVAQAAAAKLEPVSCVFSEILGTAQRLEDEVQSFELGTTSATTNAESIESIVSTGLTTSKSSDEIESAIEYAAKSTGLDADLIRAVIQVESSFRTDAVSRCGAQGLMQLMPGTAKEMGVSDPFDALDNVMGGAGYLEKLLNRFGDIKLALAAYNTGQGRIAKLGITDVDDPEQYERISSGVRGYVSKVLSYWDQFKEQ